MEEKINLSLMQMCRLAACRKRSVEQKAGITRHDVSEVLEIDDAQAGRFLREMRRVGLIECIYTPKERGKFGQCNIYGFTAVWITMEARYLSNGGVPWECQIEGCHETAVPYRFRGLHLCRKHLIGA